MNLKLKSQIKSQKGFIPIIFTIIGAVIITSINFSFVNNAYAYKSISPVKGYPGGTLSISYDSKDCLVSGNGRVTVGGIEAEIKNWYPCVAYIYVTIPNNITGGDVIVYTYSGETQNIGYLTAYQPPAISSIFPTTVIPGVTEVTIKGSRFDNSKGYYDNVYFNGIKATTVRSWTDAEIVVVAPTGITAGKISIKIDPFDEIDGPPFSLLTPVITSISPANVIPGATIITVKGQNFGNKWLVGDDLYFDEKPAKEKRDVISWTDTEIKTYVPKEVTNAGIVSIKKGSWGVDTVYGPSFSIQKKVSNDTYSNYQTSYLETIRAPNAWSITKGSKNVVVAVIDDGVYVNHPDLRENIWINKNEVIGNRIDDDGNGYIDDIYGWDFISNNGEMTVKGSHGTILAGILGAVGDNDEGIAGISWDVKIMPLIVCDTKYCSPNAIINAIKYAADNGSNIINLSLGTWVTTGYSTIYNEAIKYAYNKGVIIVAAAGNGDIEGGIGQNLDIIPQSLVCNDNEQNMVIGVGAVNNDKYRLSWSNFGKCVDIYAPGYDIISTQAPNYSTVEGFYTIKNNGTSFSAPMVSGAAALLKAKYPTMSNYEIRDRLIKNSSNGVLDVYKALNQPYTYQIVKREDGSLVKTITDPTVYLIENGEKRPILSAAIFNAFGYIWDKIIAITQGEIDIYPLGPGVNISSPVSNPNIINAVDIPEGTLIRARGDIDIYIVKYVGSKKFKRLILSPSVFNNYGHLRWEDIMDVDQSIVDSFITSNLVRAVYDHKIYVLYPSGDTGEKRWVKDYNVLTRLGYDPDAVYEINQFDRDSYTTGSLIE